MDFKQLSLELELVFEDAAESPALADLHAIWQQLEPVLTELPIAERLRFGSQVIDQLAELYQTKAHYLLDEWENTYNPQDPTIANDWLQSFVRQTQYVDFSELTAPIQRRPRQTGSKPKSAPDTIVGEVPKANVLKMLDQVELETQTADALAVAHEERIQDWVAVVTQWFDTYPQPIALLQLRQKLGWPLVQLWLTLLLGGFHLETTDRHFYSPAILVSRPAA